MGRMRSPTSALTSEPRYTPSMNATASPRTLYSERKALNSGTMPLGAGWGGGGIAGGGAGNTEEDHEKLKMRIVNHGSCSYSIIHTNVLISHIYSI